MGIWFPELTALPLERYARLVGPQSLTRDLERIETLRERLAGRVVWNISSTAYGGGVAEMVRSLLSYCRGARVDARWGVITGPPDFFRLTKRLHNAIHGSHGDGSPIGDEQRHLYESVNEVAAKELAPMVRSHDVVIVHDPQPAGMIPALLALGAHVIWRCHVGHDDYDDEVDLAWRFLSPYLRDAHAFVFSRAAYIPIHHLEGRRARIIAPTIDPFSPKNQAIDERCVRAILRQAGLIDCAPSGPCTFIREDGTPGRVDRRAEIVREDAAPPDTTPLVVQVSRWDRLKDPLGVIAGFVELTEERAHGAHLVLAGPRAVGVTDDPEGARVLAEVIGAWRQLPVAMRRRIHLASIPTDDIDENAAIVNALQRYATVIVQKSLHEGFGLTVTEAMWKCRPLIASAVGGIQDQIEDGVQGILLEDPSDPREFAAALERLLADPREARRMGERGHARVIARYLGLSSVLQYGALVEWLDEGGTYAALGERERRVGP
jgi:trehalose synthase